MDGYGNGDRWRGAYPDDLYRAGHDHRGSRQRYQRGRFYGQEGDRTLDHRSGRRAPPTLRRHGADDSPYPHGNNFGNYIRRSNQIDPHVIQPVREYERGQSRFRDAPIINHRPPLLQ